MFSGTRRPANRDAQTLGVRVRGSAPSTRHPSGARHWLEFGEIRIDVDGIRAFRGGRALQLGIREFQLLSFLVRHPNVPHSRATLLKAVWPPGTSVRLSTVDTYILRLRIALRHGSEVDVIRTVRSKGYELDGSATVPDA